MKIDDTYQNMNIINNSGESKAYGKTKENGGPSPGTEKTGRSGTQVDLSNTSVEYSKAAKMMETRQTERIDKVNEIKSKINDGTYQVDADQIAEKMIKGILSGQI